MEHQNAIGDFSAIISAAGRAGEDLAPLLNVREKCAALYRGKPLVMASVEAALGAGARQVAIVCGEEVRVAIEPLPERCVLADPGTNPVDSARRGQEKLTTQGTILFLPGDMPLVRAGHVRHFLQGLPLPTTPWLATGVVPVNAVKGTFGKVPGMKSMRVGGNRYVAGGPSAASPAGFSLAVELLSELAGDRKSQFRMARKFGLANLLRYFLGFMTVEAAEAAAERAFGCPCKLQLDCDPETALDVDTVEDWEFLAGYPTTDASSST